MENTIGVCENAQENAFLNSFNSQKIEKLLTARKSGYTIHT